MDAVIGLVGVVVGAVTTLVGQAILDRRARARTLASTRAACQHRIDNLGTARAAGPPPALPQGVVSDEVHLLGGDFDRFLDAQAQCGTRDVAFEEQIRRILILHELPGGT